MLRRRLSRLLTVAVVLTFASTATTTLLLAVTVARLEAENMTLSFQQRASVRSAALGRALEQAIEVLTVTNQMFSAVQPATRGQFHDFTTPLLERYGFIQTLTYHRLVHTTGRIGLADQSTNDLNLPRIAFDKTERFLEPMASNDATLRNKPGPGQGSSQASDSSKVQPAYVQAGRGAALNAEGSLGSSPDQRERLMLALQRAARSGHAESTGLRKLASDTDNNSGYEVIMPVYRAGADLATPAMRQAALVGATAVILRARQLVQQTLTDGKLRNAGIDLWVYAGASADPAQLVYSSRPNIATPAIANNPPLARWLGSEARTRDTYTMIVGGQTWHVVAGVSAQSLLPARAGSLSCLVGGLLLTVLFTALVHTLSQRSRRVQALVKERTRELHLSNARLQDDVSARKHTELALQDSEQRFRQLVSMSSDWYWEQDANLRFTSISGRFGEPGGQVPAQLIGRTRWETVHGMADSAWGQAHIATLMARQPFTELEYATRDDAGQLRWVCVSGQPLFDADGQFSGYRGTGTDITPRKLSEQRIAHVAQHDVLTGLPNRSLLQDRLRQAVSQSMRSGDPVWVMLIDLDRFKFVNDSMGHRAGDVLLMTIAARLRAGLRDTDTDTVARLSGDEFVVILAGPADAPLNAAIVHGLMGAVAEPIMLGSKAFFVTCSVGVSVFPADGAEAEAEAEADTLIERADIAMYCAKKMGRNNVQFYTPAMNEEAMERVRIEGALRNALERNEFVLHYQPQVDLASGQIKGMEALLRWQHPELGMVAPSRFISVAEETGLIAPIGAWVMRTACAQTKLWQQAGLGTLRVAVNLSARQFGASDLLADIKDVLEHTGLAPACLDIELTESLFMNDVTSAVEVLHGMKSLGVNLSIDDFGTGYSSLSYLSRFPIDVLKIDRSFVSDIGRDASDAAIVASIITLAHNLKLSVIAEGVETAEQLDYLGRHGCDEMQGYLFSRPLAAADFEQLLRANACLPAASPG